MLFTGSSSYKVKEIEVFKVITENNNYDYFDSDEIDDYDDCR